MVICSGLLCLVLTADVYRGKYGAKYACGKSVCSLCSFQRSKLGFYVRFNSQAFISMKILIKLLYIKQPQGKWPGCAKLRRGTVNIDFFCHLVKEMYIK